MGVPRVANRNQVLRVRPKKVPALQRISTYFINRALARPEVRVFGTRTTPPVMLKRRTGVRRIIPVRTSPPQKPKPVKINFTPKRK